MFKHSTLANRISMFHSAKEWLPFSDAPWSQDQREAYDLIVAWSRQVRQLSGFDKNREGLAQLFLHESDLIGRGEPGKLVPAALCEQVFDLSRKHGLPLAWFATQVKAAHRFYAPMRFATGTDLKQFLQDAIIPRGYLVAKLADVAHRWQLPQVSDLSTAFFLVNKLIDLKNEIENDRVYIPLSDLELAGVSVEDLKRGHNAAGMQKLLWKQVIRIRDAFAQGQPLVKEVPRKFRRSFKKNWLEGLEFVSELERRDYDLWSGPITLSSVQRFQISVLSVIGKGAAKARGR